MDQVVALPDWTQVTAAVAGAVSAVAGAIAAGASWRSALQSNAAARDVREALGLAMKPAIDISPFNQHRVVGDADPVQVYGVEIKNASLWPAVDLEIDCELHDGRKLSGKLPRVGGVEVKGKALVASVDLLTEVIPKGAALGGAPQFPGIGMTEVGERTLIDKVVVRYWDERHLLRWEQTSTDRMHLKFDGRFQLQGNERSKSERRLPN